VNYYAMFVLEVLCIYKTGSYLNTRIGMLPESVKLTMQISENFTFSRGKDHCIE